MSDIIPNPLDYGVLPSGFSRMRLPEIRQAIITSLQTSTGLTFETRPDSITGQFIDVFADREATVWELAEAVYHAMYPISAFGVNLDHAVSFSGVRRLFAQQSLAWAVLYGTEGTVVPVQSVVRSNLNSEDFATTLPITISQNAAGDITVSVDTATVGQEYYVRIDSIYYRYTAVAGDTNVSIANQLGALLIASRDVVELDANHIRIYTVTNVPFAVMISTGMSIVTRGTIAVVQAINYGPIEVTANSLNQIITVINGWNSVNNIVDGQMGRAQETDDELRLRYSNGVYRLGAATLPAILANLQQDIIGLQSVQVYENVSDTVDADGRSAHSIEVVAFGGDPQQIGNEIFNLKAAGIDTYGDTTVTVVDASGYNHPINFSRPQPVYVWVNCTVYLYSEEVFPPNGDQVIQQTIVDTGNLFGIGTDIIIQRFYGPIYQAVSGVGKIDITVAIEDDTTTTPAPGDYTPINVAIAVRELARFDLVRVSVTVSSL
jgi:uncharacterized phage protein gp47/JayE